MMQPRWILSLLILAILPLAASAQAKRRDARVIFKDGFHINGKIEEQVRDVIFDSGSGQAFPIPSGNFFIDDHVRKIIFSPMNVLKVTQLKVGEIKEPMQIQRIKFFAQTRELHSTWEYTGFSKWGGAGDRTFGVRTSKGTMEITQKIGLFTPQYLAAISIDYRWNLMYFTSEFSAEEMRAMLLKVFEEKKDLKKLAPGQKFLEIAGFLQEAGWFKEAEIELANIVDNFPNEKKIAETMLERLRKDRANIFVESIKQANKVGQHQVALERLDDYAALGYAKLVSPDYRGIANDFKTEYAKAKTSIEAARKLLKDLPSYVSKKNQPEWIKATEFIVDELNYDTVGRLDKFLLFAAQHETQRAARCKPTQTTEEVLAMAVSSWLQGDQSAESDTKSALKLAHAREFLLEYLNTTGELKRANLLSTFKSDNDLPMDVLAQVLRMIPPHAAHEAKNLNRQIQTIKIEAPNANGGSYLVQLPHDYHHQRAYPVVMVLHSGRGTENAEDTLKRFSDDAAKHGFILVAPHWPGKAGLSAAWRYSKREQDVVLDTLRDLRRRFQVDSDRVFLFGWEEGAKGAFDVGLAHPDQFAGVAPMNGSLTPFAKRYYWPNAQYLPFYVIEGEKNGGNAKQMQELFKEWTREPFASMYVEYKGRASEWFSAEVPMAMNWMSKKKRYSPMKEMGRAGNGGGLGEEFRSSRGHDYRFYWLSSEAIADRCLGDHTAALRTIPLNYQPATFQANLTVGNKLKKDGKDDIWNQVNVRVNGMKQVTFWITPEMKLNLALPFMIFVNGQQVGPRRQISPSLETLLEELYQSGDRQRLYVAKIEVKM